MIEGAIKVPSYLFVYNLNEDIVPPNAFLARKSHAVSAICTTFYAKYSIRVVFDLITGMMILKSFSKTKT